jgi:hypothetical protein
VDFQEATEFTYSGKTRYLSADDAIEFEVGVERYAGKDVQEGFFRYQPSDDNQNLFSIRHENDTGTAAKAVFGRRFADDWWFRLGVGYLDSDLPHVDSSWFTSIDASIPAFSPSANEPRWLSVHITSMNGQTASGSSTLLTATPELQTSSVFRIGVVTDFQSRPDWALSIDFLEAVRKVRARRLK